MTGRIDGNADSSEQVNGP